ncbi:DUF6116 family protein [Lysobacter zhanggongensis]|uniref:DUF6116 family protein n=1 Tax=Lysobacter zhanggongensis TaxID=1774951 RepID=A0ABU7YPP0_9GAMM
MRTLLLAPLMRFLGKLSYPRLFMVAAALFVLDMLVPDMVPFVDELLLGLGTLLLANWKKRKDPDSAKAERDVIDGDARRR